MADKFINDVGLQAIKTWIEGKFALDADLDDLSDRVDDIEAAGGEPNVIETVKVNNTALVPDANKAVNIDLSGYAEAADIPTTTSDLTNDSDYQTGTDVQGAIDAALADITGIDFQVVQTLPATGEHGVIYLVPKSGAATGYDEYIWITPSGGTAHFEQIGDTSIDLTSYWTSNTGQSNTLVAMTVSEINTILNA